ncbi:MAG: DinB family protein [Chloroflexota bacterium]
MSSLETIRLLFRYNYWAWARVWECVTALSDEQFSRQLPFAWNSVHEQVVHVMGGESIWIYRMQGGTPENLFYVEDYPTRADVRQRWDVIEANAFAFLDALTQEQLDGDFTYHNTKGEQYTNSHHNILLHVVNHSTDHRAQILAMMHFMGAQTIEQDMIHFAW